MQRKEIRVGGFRESFPEEKTSGLNACQTEKGRERWEEAGQEDGWQEGGKASLQFKRFHLYPSTQGTLAAWEEARLTWAGSWIRAERQLLLTPPQPQQLNPSYHMPALLGQPLPNATCQPGWLSHPEGSKERARVPPGFFFFLTELPPNSVFSYKIKNSGPILTTYFGGHKSTSPVFFCFSKKIIILELASRLSDFSSYFSWLCIFKPWIQWAQVKSFCSQSGNLSSLVDLVSLPSSQFGVALLLQMMSMKIVLSRKIKWSGLLKHHRSH